MEGFYYRKGESKVKLEDYLLILDKEWIISKISNRFDMNQLKVTNIINYLTNEGSQQIMEFPLFTIDNFIITIPSLIMLNDWQFTTVNGHHFKNIDFINKQKTISISTQIKLRKIVQKKQDILWAEERYYEFIEEGKTINSDIDFALYEKE